MSNLIEDSTKNTKIIKHYIKDLSFENLQDVNSQNFSKDDGQVSSKVVIKA